ncbi:MAG: winged helix-turn-helix transcriptional regulator [Nitrososphaerota archaeon]|nr:winged helix-turn-helix transcriptional regulator [Nitrososphaerota archaeon]
MVRIDATHKCNLLAYHIKNSKLLVEESSWACRNVDVPPESEPRRDQIVNFIRTHPGVHLREIKREIDLAMGVLQYHLYKLEKDRVIVSRRRGLYKRYYINLVFGETDLDVLDVLSQNSERDILLYITLNQGVGQRELSVYSKLSTSTVLWHLKRLISVGLIEARQQFGNTTYSIRVDRDSVFQLLKSYHPTLWERWADTIADVVVNVDETEGVTQGS